MQPRRSDSTRAAILGAARERFAAQGYRGATIRAIAADASIDPSMVMRYYGTKAGLFAAAVNVDLALPDLTGVPKSQAGRTLVAHFLDRWEGDRGDDGLLVLLRSATVDDDAAQRMQAMFAEQLLPVVTTVVDDDTEAPRRAALIATQMLGLALCRHLLRLAPVVEMSPGEIVATLGDTVQRYLHRPIGTGSRI